MVGRGDGHDLEGIQDHQVRYYLLVICGEDWQEKVNLAVFDHPPTQEEKIAVLTDYWQQYETELFHTSFEFIKSLQAAEEDNKAPWKKGIWVEEVILNPIIEAQEQDIKERDTDAKESSQSQPESP